MGSEEIAYAMLRERNARNAIKSLQNEFVSVIKKQAKPDFSLRKKVRRMQQAKHLGKVFNKNDEALDLQGEFVNQMKTVFKIFDVNHSGYLDRTEIRTIIGTVNQP